MAIQFFIPKDAAAVIRQTGADVVLAVHPTILVQKEHFLDQVKLFLDAFTVQNQIKKNTLLVRLVSADERKFGKLSAWLRYENAIRVADAGGWEYDERWEKQVGGNAMKQYGIVE